MAIALDELRAYNEEERAKWDTFFRTHDALDLPLQTGGSFPTVWDLIDHIFSVKKRHLQRLRSEYPLSESTGIARVDRAAMGGFAAAVRSDLLQTIEELQEAGVPRPYPITGGTRLLTPCKVLFHVFLHEARHWAQISLAVRNAGLEPPSDQDLIFSSALP